ncbi:MAG: hypothetical protein P1U74_02075 [Legionellaceae bacterium]|nr:hypothetical protein [Legionellaceae bacterium]
MLSRIEPPSAPMCFENDKYNLAIEQIFYVFSQFLGEDVSKKRVHVSGGCLMKTYNNSDLSEAHKRVFGDIDWKISRCSEHEIAKIISYVQLYKKNDGNLSSDDSSFYGVSQLFLAIKQLIVMGDELEFIYNNSKKTLISGQLKERKQTVIKMRWYGNISLDIVMFQESIEEHLLGTDISATAGYYNPLMSKICFPCDGFPETDSSGRVFPSNRSAKDFINKEINLLFPKQYESMFDCDPTRIFHIIWSVNSSDFSLSQELSENIKEYAKKRKGSVFIKIKPGQLYNNLKLMFFKGYAVKNLEMLVDLGLIDELFTQIDLSAHSRELAMYLIKKVAVESDSDYSLWPSLLPYAIYWEDVKNRAFSPYLIQEFSHGRLSIYFRKFNLEDGIYRDDLNERIHEANIELLKSWEVEYQNSMMNSVISSAIDAATTTINEIQSRVVSQLMMSSMIDLIHKQVLLEDIQEQSSKVAETTIDDAVLQVQSRAGTAKLFSSTDQTDSKESIEAGIVHCTELITIDAYSGYCKRGNLYMRLGQYKNATNDFILAVKHNNILADAFYYLGNVEIKLAENHNPQVSSAEVKRKLRPSNSIFEEDYQRYLDLQNGHYAMAASYYEKALARNPMYHDAKRALQSIGALIKRKKPKNEKSYTMKHNIPFSYLKQIEPKEPVAVSNSVIGTPASVVDSKKTEHIFDKKKYNDLSSRYEVSSKKLVDIQKVSLVERAKIIREFDEIILQCCEINNYDFFILQVKAYISKGQGQLYTFTNQLRMGFDIDLADEYAKVAIDSYEKAKEKLLKSSYADEGVDALLKLIARSIAQINLEKGKFYFENPSNGDETKKQEKRRLARGKDKLERAENHFMEVLNYSLSHSQTYTDLAEIEKIRAKYLAKDSMEKILFLNRAKEHYLKNRDLSPESREVYLELGNIAMLIGNVQESILYYTTSFSLLKQDSSLLAKQKKYTVFSEWANSIVSEKKIALTGTDRFFTIESQEPVDEEFKTLLAIAREGYLEALKYSSDDYDNFYYTLIIIDLLIENHNYAISDIGRALSIHNERSAFTQRVLLLLYGMAYEMSGDIYKAKKNYAKAGSSSLFPDDFGGAEKFIGVAKDRFRKVLISELNSHSVVPKDDVIDVAESTQSHEVKALISTSIFQQKPAADASEDRDSKSTCDSASPC